MALNTLSDLRTEMQARGFDYLSSTRCNTYLNLAYQSDLCEESDWPFLRTSTTGTAPITITDLRTVKYVQDTTNSVKLRHLGEQHITDADLLTTTGNPECYYATSETTLDVYPANTTATLKVVYYKTPPELDDDSDTILVPARWRYAIVEKACAYAYADSDNEAGFQAAEARYNRFVQRMREAYQLQHDRPDYISVLSGSDDWNTAQYS